MQTEIVLTKAQQEAFNGLLEGIAVGGILVLQGSPGSGRTTILEMIHAAKGGVLIGAREFLGALMSRDPGALEEAFLRMIEDALYEHDLIMIDDLHLVTNIVGARNYPRAYLLDAALTALLAEARVLNKTLIFAAQYGVPWAIDRRAYTWEIGDFTVADYQQIGRAHLPAGLPLDFNRIYRFAPGLNAHQLKNASAWLARNPALDTEVFIEYLRSKHMDSNVEIEEVQPVKWSDLKGVDDVIRVLEAKVALPFQNDALATEWGLKPKRGVLIAGPTGTGNTTIGRALAHRLKSKFFLIDGTVVAGSCDFIDDCKEIFEKARRNAPSVVFIDDTGVIFDGNREGCFYRYLLTVLDGLESTSSERVCVMMTAMNPGCLPPAILRSGRIELWLDTRLPDTAAREQILRGLFAFAAADLRRVAESAKGLTGADLKAIVEDAKLLFAHDVSTGTPVRAPEQYFADAIEEVRTNHRNQGRHRPVRLGQQQSVGFA